MATAGGSKQTVIVNIAEDSQFAAADYTESDCTTPTTVTTSSHEGEIESTVVGTFLNTPASLENAVDYNAATATSGDAYSASAKQLSHTGRHKFDFKTALIGGQQLRIKIGLWGSSTAGATAYLDYSNDGVNWTQDQQLATNTATSEQVYDQLITPNNLARYYAIRHTYPNDVNAAFLKIYSMHIEGATYLPAANAKDANTGTRWKSRSEVGPWIKADMGSAAEILGVAIHFHSDTTITQFKIEASPTDSSYVRKKTVPYSLITAGAWAIILFPRHKVTCRYVKITGLDGPAKIMSVNELKVLTLTESVINRRHRYIQNDPDENCLTLTGA